MKKNRINRNLLTLFILICTLLAFSAGASAAGKTRLSRSKKTLTVGKSFTLTLKNNKKAVKWKTSAKKKLALKKISRNKVKLTAKKKGKVTVTAKTGKKTYKCKITIKPKKKAKADIPAAVRKILKQETLNANGDTISLSGCNYAYTDCNRDGSKDLIIRPKADVGGPYGSTYIYIMKNGSYECVGSLPSSGMVSTPGYSKKRGTIYLFSHSHMYDILSITLYSIKDGKLTEGNILSVDESGYYLNGKHSSERSFKTLYSKFFDGPLPQVGKMWDGYTPFDFSENEYQ